MIEGLGVGECLEREDGRLLCRMLCTEDFVVIVPDAEVAAAQHNQARGDARVEDADRSPRPHVGVFGQFVVSAAFVRHEFHLRTELADEVKLLLHGKSSELGKGESSDVLKNVNILSYYITYVNFIWRCSETIPHGRMNP